VPWRARDFRPLLLRRRAGRPQLKREPLAGNPIGGRRLPERPEPIPTTRCLSCGTEYATACPACPYCDWVPLRPGRANWERKTFIAVGIMVSVGLAVVVMLIEDAAAFHVRGMGGYAFAGGVLLTIVLANRYIGGGKDDL